MDLPDDLLLFHQPVRLRIMGLLYRHRDVGYTEARDTLELTDGNLASHVKRLEDAGHVRSRRVLTRDGFTLRYQVTSQGSHAFRAYLGHLRRFLDAQLQEPPSTTDTPTEGP